MAKLLTNNEYIATCIIAHNGRYSYDKTHYIKASEKVVVTCKKHGDFLIRAGRHAKENKGCQKCSREEFIKNKTCKVEDFVEAANVSHNYMYDYDIGTYVNMSKKMTIICPTHGKFQQTPTAHVSKKNNGCKQCSIEYTARLKFNRSKLLYVLKAKQIHNDKYDYSKTKYTGSLKKLIVTCPIHGDFKLGADRHLLGQGCSGCSKSGFDKTRPAILYYLSVDDGEAYKIGITNRTVEARFSKSDLSKIRVIFALNYDNGQDAYNSEQKILKDNKVFKYIGADLLESGNTELFNIDILNKDNNNESQQ